jgi:hypothetical protein
MDLKA